MIKPLSSEKELTDLLANKEAVLLKFEADWCGPCKAIAPYVTELGTKAADLNVLLVNTDKPEFYTLVQAYKVRSIPHLVYISPTGEVATATGARSKKEIYNLTGRQP